MFVVEKAALPGGFFSSAVLSLVKSTALQGNY
jgi:hypothetical protein